MAKENRPTLMLECTVCHERNYPTTKSVKITKERLELKKFCNRCREHTVHKESK